MRSMRMLLPCLVLLAACPVAARIITVDPRAGGDYLTLPQAWGPAGAADTVLMVAGTHLVGHGMPGWPLTLNSDSPTVMGPEAPGEAVLLGDGTTVAFVIPANTHNARMYFSRLTFRSLGELFKRAGSVEDGGTLKFTDNVVETCGSSYYVYALDASSCGSTAVIARNIIRNNPGMAIELFHNSGQVCDNEICYNLAGMGGVCCETPKIERNHVHHNTGGGIGTSFSYTVRDNLIEYNGYGLSIGSGGSFTGNVVRYNTIGVKAGETYAYFHHNDIYGNTAYNVQVRWSGGGTVTWNCTMNWWGTTDPAAIAGSIWDRNDDPGLLVSVNFEPWCEAPGCEVTHAEQSSWGSIKALFR
jgi:hypothetical protein